MKNFALIFMLLFTSVAFSTERIESKYQLVEKSFEELLNASWQVTGVSPNFILKKGSKVILCHLLISKNGKLESSCHSVN
jgi:hypothetical protein